MALACVARPSGVTDQPLRRPSRLTASPSAASSARAVAAVSLSSAGQRSDRVVVGETAESHGMQDAQSRLGLVRHSCACYKSGTTGSGRFGSRCRHLHRDCQRTEVLPLPSPTAAPRRLVPLLAVLVALASLTLPAGAAGSTTIVINELQAQGAGGAADEFIELYNPSTASVDVAGWRIRRSSGTGGTVATLATLPAGLRVPPNGSYLLAGSAFPGAADQRYASSHQRQRRHRSRAGRRRARRRDRAEQVERVPRTTAGGGHRGRSESPAPARGC